MFHHGRHTSKRKRERPKHLYQTARNLSAWHLTLGLRASASQRRNTTPSPLPPAACKRPGKLTPEAWGGDPAGSLLTRSPTRRVGVPSCLRSAGVPARQVNVRKFLAKGRIPAAAAAAAAPELAIARHRRQPKWLLLLQPRKPRRPLIKSPNQRRRRVRITAAALAAQRCLQLSDAVEGNRRLFVVFSLLLGMRAALAKPH
jgi:hypothetical protein